MNNSTDERGLVFHIIHGSFVDGYGTRTTVFLKGCPLRCIWCCNPEGQKMHAELKVTASHCNGCARCVTACPKDAITLDTPNTGPLLRVDRTFCDECLKCIDVCFTGALDKFGTYYTVDELFKELKKDEQFYRASGGGVTIGGGEATCQPTFTLNVIRKCRRNYIHTALDTCGYITTEDGLAALMEADLALYDLKVMDPQEHLRYMGLPNGIILENLKKRDAANKPTIIRIPLIPGYTDGDTNLRSMAEFLSGLNCIDRVDLLAVHEFGKVKYDQLGMQYKLSGVQPVSEDRLAAIKAFFEGYGLRTQLGG
jgi:pyruvate formate lyase activating enzyme